MANHAGISLRAGVSCKAHSAQQRERLCRYIARPPLAVKRLSLSRHGKVVYTLKTPYRDGTTQGTTSLSLVAGNGCRQR